MEILKGQSHKEDVVFETEIELHEEDEIAVNTKDEPIVLTKGSTYNLAEGSKLDIKSALNELIDDGLVDNNSSKTKIIFCKERNKLTLFFKEPNPPSVEKSKDILDTYGKSGRLKTLPGGVGKYNQGFLHSCSYLIGIGNSGYVRFESMPNDGKFWSKTRYFDNTDEEQFSDSKTSIDNKCHLVDDYNVMVEIGDTRLITDLDIALYKESCSRRYKGRLEKGCILEINGEKIEPTDRLYGNFGERVKYYKSDFLEWNGDTKAAIFESSDLSSSMLNEKELIPYDTSLGIQGRQKGTNVGARSCIEICVNGVSIIEDGELESIIGNKKQPSSASFRGRLTLYNQQMIDEYIRGSNKSNCQIQKNFLNSPSTEKIRKIVCDKYNEALISYKKNESTKNEIKSYQIPSIDKLCEKENISVRFRFKKDEKNVELVEVDTKNNIIFINSNNLFFAGSSDDTVKKFIIHCIYDIKNEEEKTIERLSKKIKSVKNYCEENE